MSRVRAKSERIIAATPTTVYNAIKDYQTTRPQILTPNYLNYKVEKGGVGDGTVISYHLHAAGRERPYHINVMESKRGTEITERDTGSSLVTTWTVKPVNGGEQTKVRIATEWQGSGGVGGFFERTFAPLGLQSIYNKILVLLADEVQPAGASVAEDEDRPSNDLIIRTVALGVVAGLRSMMPLALLNWTTPSEEGEGSSLASRLSNLPATRISVTTAALGEIFADKLPTTPSRIKPGPLLGRIAIGGQAGATMFQRANRPAVMGAAIGAAGATLGSFIGYYSRTLLDKNTKVPDTVWGTVEDVIAFSLGLFAVRS